MKKARRGTIEEDNSNAADVFGATSQSQEELLAAALGEDQVSSSTDDGNVGGDELITGGKKNKKKKKKSLKIDSDDDNAIDVFAGTNMSQEELLANALGESVDTAATAATAAPSKGKKKKGKKGGAVIETEDNAVDVFGSLEKSQEELLADALGEGGNDESVAASKKVGKKKKKKGKKGIIEDESNAVDVLGSIGKSQEELLAESFGKTTIAEQSGSPVVFENHLDVSKTATSTPTEVTEGMLAEEDDVKDEVDESFEPDPEVIEEFEKTTEEFIAFTAQGRRKKAKSKRGDRNNEDSRLGDLKRANFGSGGEKYTSVRFEDVTITFRSKPVLDGVTWGIHSGERVGLIGENGCGKTTQLRMIAGSVEPTSGEIVRSSDKTKASFLRQEFVDELDPTRTLREEFLSAFTEECKLLKQYEQCERDIEIAGENMGKLESLLNLMEDLRVKCDQKDAWNLDSKIDRVMPGLGFNADDNDKLVASFSGGWKVRIGLGKVLMQDPDLLLLDEPSNHLDNESVEWLEDYLRTCKLPMVVVSHDREFLDRVCTKIVEIESGEAFEYPGNYTTFVKLKKEQRAAWESAYEKQQKFVKDQTNFIKRNRRSPARVSQVKSREKMLERMERTGQMVKRPPRQGKPLMFRFPHAPRSGRDCILIEDLTHGYGERNLFEDAAIGIERGDRIALIGPNGSGKTTLLRLITGREKAQNGSVECGSLTNISLAYYEQNQADALDLDITVLNTLKDAAPTSMAYEEVRALLGKFLFKGDDVEKKVEALSGGEKARLALAKIMLTPANVLILDEPGNHLSISAKEMLEEALQNFDGTLLLVSHDRYLISQVATQIIAVEGRDLVLYDGDYKAYMEKNEELKEKLEARYITGVSEIKNAPKITIEDPIEFVEKKTKRKRNFGGSGINSGKTKEMNAKRWTKR